MVSHSKPCERPLCVHVWDSRYVSHLNLSMFSVTCDFPVLGSPLLTGWRHAKLPTRSRGTPSVNGGRNHPTITAIPITGGTPQASVSRGKWSINEMGCEYGVEHSAYRCGCRMTGTFISIIIIYNRQPDCDYMNTAAPSKYTWIGLWTHTIHPISRILRALWIYVALI